MNECIPLGSMEIISSKQVSIITSISSGTGRTQEPPKLAIIFVLYSLHRNQEGLLGSGISLFLLLGFNGRTE